MKKTKLIFVGFFALKHVKMLAKLIALNETVGHFYSFCFHGMFLTEVVIGDRIVVEIADSAHTVY